jgi:fluoride exporter
VQQLLLVAVGGALGAASRYGVARLALGLGLVAFPWATWAVNLAGCFLLGLVFPWLAQGSARLYALAAVGFLGAFTTFSTYSLDTLLLVENGKAGLAVLNALGSVVAGLALAALGLYLGRWMAAS